MLKLHHYGIWGKNLKWIENFLKNWSQQVIVEGVISSVAQVKSYVPKGSVLDPLLFLVYINDLPLAVSSTIGLFAVDTDLPSNQVKRRYHCSTKGTCKDALVKWEQTWPVKFHPNKFQVLTIINKREIIRFNYKIQNKWLEKVDHAKYSGVHIDKKLLWKYHVSSIISTANPCGHFLQWNLVTCNPETKLQCL